MIRMRVRNANRAQQLLPKKMKRTKNLKERDKNFVSVINLWRQKLGISFTHNGTVTRWIESISIFSFIIITISQVVSFFQTMDDTAKMFECFSVTTFCFVGLQKLYSLKGRQQCWYSLLSSAIDLEVQELNDEDPLKVDYESDEEDDVVHRQITKYTQFYFTITYLMNKIYLATVSIYIMSPFIEQVIWKIQGAEILEYPHIVPVYTDLEKMFFPLYVITIIAEVITSVYCVCIHLVFDLSLIGMMIFIHGQFVLLHKFCERIGGKGRNCNLSVERDLRAHFRISKCQRIHASLIKSVNELSGLTVNVLGIYFNVATLILCSVALQVSSYKISATHVFMLLQYMIASLIQLFLFCYFGDDVFNASAVSLGEGPSASAWWCLSAHIRREVALLCMSMSRRHRLQAGPFHLVDLSTFIQIIRTAYSYYAVIRQTSN